jgi:hypothetical protein
VNVTPTRFGTSSSVVSACAVPTAYSNQLAGASSDTWDSPAACEKDTVGAMFVAALVFLYVGGVAVEYTNRVMEWW